MGPATRPAPNASSAAISTSTKISTPTRRQDDIDLAVGRLRIRKSGSCGGHNGIRNVIERLGTQAFVRVKIGVGKDKSNVVGHVLGKFDPETRKVMDLVVAEAAKAVGAVLREGPDRAMNAYNGFDATAK